MSHLGKVGGGRNKQKGSEYFKWVRSHRKPKDEKLDMTDTPQYPTTGAIQKYVPISRRTNHMQKILRQIKIFFSICPNCPHGHLFKWSLGRLDCDSCSNKVY